jgi:hypothetical protein
LSGSRQGGFYIFQDLSNYEGPPPEVGDYSEEFKDSIDLENKGFFEIAATTGDERIQRFVSLYAAAVYRDKVIGENEVRQLKKILDELDV